MLRLDATIEPAALLSEGQHQGIGCAQAGLEWRGRVLPSIEAACCLLSVPPPCSATAPSCCKHLGFFEKPTRESPVKLSAAVRQGASPTALSLACPHELCTLRNGSTRKVPDEDRNMV